MMIRWSVLSGIRTYLSYYQQELIALPEYGSPKLNLKNDYFKLTLLNQIYTIGFMCHNPSFINSQIWMASPFFFSKISSLDIRSTPTAIAYSLPSAITAIGALTGNPSINLPPSDRRPGAITLDPEKICLMAPLSHCI